MAVYVVAVIALVVASVDVVEVRVFTPDTSYEQSLLVGAKGMSTVANARSVFEDMLLVDQHGARHLHAHGWRNV